MIPTYNPGRYLEKTLESVLLQDPGPQEMQIEVVDDCSTNIEVEELIRRVAGDRVSVFRQPERTRKRSHSGARADPWGSPLSDFLESGQNSHRLLRLGGRKFSCLCVTEAHVIG
jgi:cellulose synthase/poly-beta-1,6-N-acetylglucosamine synthase-like glycosyltransferase